MSKSTSGGDTSVASPVDERTNQDQLNIDRHVTRLIGKPLVARPEVHLVMTSRGIEQAKLVVLAGAEPDPIHALTTHDHQAIHARILILVADEEPHPRISEFVLAVNRSDHLIPGWTGHLLDTPVPSGFSV